MKFIPLLTFAAVVTTAGAEIIISTDFSDTSKDGTTMNDITWTTGGISAPSSSLTVENTILANGTGNLFITTDAEGYFAPSNNTSNGGAWNFEVDFSTLGGPIELENLELDYRHFNGGGDSQTVERDANYTVEIRDGSGTALPGSSITINTPDINTNDDDAGPQTISFDLVGVTLSANTDYTLFIGAADSDGPAGNNTGFGGFVLNGSLSSPAIQIREIVFDNDANTVTLTWDSQPGDTFIIRFSPDLIDWTANLITEELADPDGTTTTQEFDLTDTGANGLPKVFFRVEK